MKPYKGIIVFLALITVLLSIWGFLVTEAVSTQKKNATQYLEKP